LVGDQWWEKLYNVHYWEQNLQRGTKYEPRPGNPIPYVLLEYSGNQLLSYIANSFVPLPLLQDYIKPTSARANTPRCSWWGIEVEGTDITLVFPSAGTNFVIGTDFDGASIWPSAYRTKDRIALKRSQLKFAREWGKWLNPYHNIDDIEMRVGIRRAEQAIAARINSEQTEWERI